MKATFAASVTLASLIAAPAIAQEPAGDAEAGAALFERQCITCHVVVDDDGETLAGRNARTGPNLYAIAERTAGTVDGFRYSNGIEALNEMGLEWTEENFVGYVQDPTPWIRETADSNRLRGSMTWKVRSEEEAQDLYAYLYSLAPPEGEGS